MLRCTKVMDKDEMEIGTRCQEEAGSDDHSTTRQREPQSSSEKQASAVRSRTLLAMKLQTCATPCHLLVAALSRRPPMDADRYR